mmetsp:Transcript_17404/g.44801  ORF Transcript_17404/g.44801 Transcript_17404/m.44801 type:complete len:203 (+) Transcript_17404:99-707(+)
MYEMVIVPPLLFTCPWWAGCSLATLLAHRVVHGPLAISCELRILLAASLDSNEMLACCARPDVRAKMASAYGASSASRHGGLKAMSLLAIKIVRRRSAAPAAFSTLSEPASSRTNNLLLRLRITVMASQSRRELVDEVKLVIRRHGDPSGCDDGIAVVLGWRRPTCAVLLATSSLLSSALASSAASAFCRFSRQPPSCSSTR